MADKPSRWSAERGGSGADYDARFAAIAASGKEMHGEADFIQRYTPATVLDAGCGTGRVAIELHNRGIEAVGTDLDASMLAQAHQKAPDIEWVEADLANLELDREFDVVAMAGNVMIYLAPGSEPQAVAAAARHVAPGGRLIAGFQLNGIVSLDDYDDWAAAAGLGLVERYATWDLKGFVDGNRYAVSVHQRGR